MKKQILNLGKRLNKPEQKLINGGKKYCSSHSECGPGYCCNTLRWCQSFEINTGFLCDGSL